MRGFKNFLKSFRPLPVPKASLPGRYRRGALLDERCGSFASVRLNAEGNVALSSGHIMTEERMKALVERVKRYDF